jgi:hypothetical protein
MLFGPLELQACGENNFTMKALGLLAFRSDLQRRFVQKLLDVDVLSPDNEEVTMLFFSRIGEGFFREAIERDRYSVRGDLEKRLNAALNLPADFKWRRNQDGRITQPAKWQSSHIDDMLQANGEEGNRELHDSLAFLQDCLNTEPDIVLQWGNKLALVEIKVLSSEGVRQVDRQKRLAEILCTLLGWQPPLFFLIGPEHGNQPSSPECRFISWATVAHWFSDVPEIAEYIQSFAFFYHGHWQSMLSATSPVPGQTAYDLMLLNPVEQSSSIPQVTPESPDPSAKNPGTPENDPWHYSHLGREYFLPIVRGCKQNGVWPLRWIWVGTTGVPFAEKSNGRQINPNWMVEDEHGHRRTRSSGFGKEGRYAEGRMRRFSYDDVAQYFDLPSQ